MVPRFHCIQKPESVRGLDNYAHDYLCIILFDKSLHYAPKLIHYSQNHSNKFLAKKLGTGLF